MKKKNTTFRIGLMILGLLMTAPALGAKKTYEYAPVDPTTDRGMLIYAASETGSYTNDFCPEVQTVLTGGWFEHRCVVTKGTGDNVSRVLINPKHVALGQMDVVAQKMVENPGKLAVAENTKIGFECLYAVTNSPQVQTLNGINPRVPVALPSKKSGSTATFEILQGLDPNGLGKLRRITYYDSAMDAVDAVVSKSAAIAFFVQFANTGNAVFEKINDNDLTFIPVINRNILRFSVGEQRVYMPKQVKVTDAGFSWTEFSINKSNLIFTTCTPLVLFTGNPEEMTGADKIDQLDVLTLLGSVPRPQTKKWSDIFSNAIDVSSEVLDNLVEEIDPR